MRRVSLLIVLFAAVVGLAGRGAAERTDAGQILIVADERPQMDKLAEFLRKQGGYETVYVEQEELAGALGGYRAVFMYIHGAMTRRTERILIDYAVGGGRLIVLHHGIASAKLNNPAWLEMVGVWMNPRNHPTAPWRVIADTRHTIVNLRPGHYVTSHRVEWPGKIEYTPSDAPSTPQVLPAIALEDTEVFLNQLFTDGRAKTVLLGFHCVDAAGEVFMQDRGGWYKAVGRGLLFYFQAGHRAEDFADRNYAQMLLNAVEYRPALSQDSPGQVEVAHEP